MSDQIINKYNYTQNAMQIQAQRIERATGNNAEVSGINQTQPAGSSFQSMLQEQLNRNESVTFSKHAAQRTQQRNITLSSSDVAKLGEACAKANKKGIKEALVVMNDSAFIVNTPNKVVVTVVDKNEMKENVFTNIDGALFI